ncbi:MAG: hypothetical protein Q9M40_12940 [Sulfurimonas sp.]|nr:hypothetical protein [Sulfurimonas sp.]MDQ7068792.1 hypothetical protein [Sulfurimonas sp.]
MAISSTTSGSSIGLEAQKKAQDVQGQQVLKILESTIQQTEQMQKASSQKTGLGLNLNISA